MIEDYLDPDTPINHMELNTKARQVIRKAVNKYSKKIDKTEKRRKYHNELTMVMMKKYPEKFRARAKLRYAVSCGRVIKLSCEVCGEIKTQGHHDDYSKPLEVRWLCDIHHKILHRKFD